MQVYALVGKSGTGKSYQAGNLCREQQIESIIDDGLFVYRNNAMAGKSAKEAPTKIGAIKTALFTDPDHRDEVAESIKQTHPESILVIGTSDEMVARIARRLGLPPIDRTIYIDDITTEDQREIAFRQRTIQGKHVVPVPTAQLKHRFSGYFMAPLRRFRSWGGGRDEADPEKTVVRPTYSYLGEYIISEKVIGDIVSLVGDEMEAVAKIHNVTAEKRAGELYVRIAATFRMEPTVLDHAKRLQEKCAYRLEEMTAFSIDGVDILIKDLEW